MIIAIPSMGRAGKVTSTDVLSGAHCTLFVPENEEQDYREHHDSVIPVPMKIKGITPTRNWILDWAKAKNERAVVQCDDDGLSFNKFEDGKPGTGVPLKSISIPDLLSNMFDMTADISSNLFGFQMANDSQFYKEYSPFSFLCVVVGNFMGILEDGQRFDERLRVKEDYDFSLQSLFRHRRVLRHNKYAFMVTHIFDKGGCSDYRTYDVELSAIRTLRKKWGSNIIRSHPEKPWEIRVRTPLKGI